MRKDGSLAKAGLLRPMEDARLLREVFLAGRIARKDLARAMRVPPSKLGAAAEALVRQGYLAQDGGRGGELRINADGLDVVGLVTGVETTEVAFMDPFGKRLPGRSERFDSGTDYLETINRIGRMAGKLRDAKRRTLGVGVAIPGQLDEHSGRVHFSPNMHHLDGRHVAANVSRVTGLPVACVHEVRALCTAERLFGAAGKFSDMAFVDISAGVGATLVFCGRNYYGRDGSAGEFGHVTVNPDGPPCGCGNRGCIEVMASNRAVCQAVEKKLRRRVAMTDVVRLAREGNPAVARIVRGAFEYLGIGLAAIVNAVNPQAIFVHGQVLDAVEDPIARLREFTDPHALPSAYRGCVIQRSTVDKAQGAVATVVTRLLDF